MQAGENQEDSLKKEHAEFIEAKNLSNQLFDSAINRVSIIKEISKPIVYLAPLTPFKFSIEKNSAHFFWLPIDQKESPLKIYLSCINSDADDHPLLRKHKQ